MPGFAPCHDDAELVPSVQDEFGPWDEREVVDQALRLVADHHRAPGAILGRAGDPPSLGELRESPLGRDLGLLARADRNGTAPTAIRAAARRVEGLLLRPLAMDDYAVPAWFWRTAVGRLLARAERTAHGANGLLTP